MSKPTDLERLAVMEYPNEELLKDTQVDSKGCGNECKNCKVCFYREEQREEADLV